MFNYIIIWETRFWIKFSSLTFYPVKSITFEYSDSVHLFATVAVKIAFTRTFWGFLPSVAASVYAGTIKCVTVVIQALRVTRNTTIAKVVMETAC